MARQLFIAVDIDGVAADSYTELSLWTERKYGFAFSKDQITSRNIKFHGHPLGTLFSEAFTEDPEIAYRFAPMEGAVEGIHELTRKGHRVIFLSARHDTILDQTRRWIEKHFGQYPVQLRDVQDLINGNTDKSSHPADLLIDDSYHNVERFVADHGNGFLFSSPWNRTVPDSPFASKITVVRDWSDIVQKVEQLTAETPRKIVVAIAGKAGHGKNTVAEIAMEYLHLAHPTWNTRVVGFADAVKEEARKRGWNGVKDEAGRTMLQDIGLNGRKDDANYWVKRLLERIIHEPEQATTVWFICDLRFVNEADLARRLVGGQVWRVERTNSDGTPFLSPLTPEQRVHPSETDLDHYGAWDAVILGSSIDQKRGQVLHALSHAGLL